MRAAVVALATLALAAAGATTAGAAGLRTGFADTRHYGDAGTQASAFDRSRDAGATVARLVLNWASVAPQVRPPGFNAANHLSPGYDWGSFDRQVQLSSARRLAPIVTVVSAPSWAEGAGPGPAGTVRPDPVELGRFAQAAATRYSGLFAGLPRIRFWQAWNEPNRDYFLMPQIARGRIVSGPWYRAMVRQFAAGVHAVSRANVVVAGGLAPLGRRGKPAPLAFMRSMLCLTKRLGRACNLRSNPVPIDAWAHHPYTSGGPTHRAPGADNVALGDLPDMRRVLRAARRLGHIRSDGRLQFWVTEFSWDTKPPDPRALATRLHARWTSEALYRMWRNGVAVVTWFRVMDDPLTTSYFQSGLFTEDGRAKRSMRAFRFPFVALRRGRGISVWGRTPTSASGVVVLERRRGGVWRRLATVRANSSGIFVRRVRSSARRGYVRARFGGETSVPFSLRYVRDRFVNPFGCGHPIPC